ncbi:MAG: DUF4272 domain-containing protein [candidate division Zixibacteria bacterium]|nr:DUF4272 domain-containing protein [candidate division Zixibacteria bacterium]
MEFTDDDCPEDVPRTATEIARRALVLSAVLTAAYGASTDQVLQWLETAELKDEISPDELILLEDPTNKARRTDITWRIERLLILLWCIKKIARLPSLSDQCDVDLLKAAIVFPPDPTAEYIASATLRSFVEIEEEREIVWQAHWTVRDAQINDRELPYNLNPEIIYERHYAFNWVVGHMGQPWDEITTDT